MTEDVTIKSFDIKEDLFEKEFLKPFYELSWADNWPIIDILNDNKTAYIGETYKVKARLKQHLKNEDKKSLKKINVIIDKKSNKSYTLDMEASLIRYMSADTKFDILNSNRGLISHNYYSKDDYRKKFEVDIWPKLQRKGLAERKLIDIQNDDLFKYSPFVPLDINQSIVVDNLIEVFANYKGKRGSLVVQGSAGTGKTIIGTYLMKLIHSKEDNFETDSLKEHLETFQNNIKKVALVIPQQSLRLTLKRVFKKIHGLNPSMVVSPNDVLKKDYDMLIVDEAHRLRRRKNLTNYSAFDKNNKELGLGNEGTELDWILKSSKYQIFFYDQDQSVKPTDITHSYFLEKVKPLMLTNNFYELESQFRVQGGSDYIDYVKRVLDCKETEKKHFNKYDLRFYENITDMKKVIIEKNNSEGLSRLVAGYGWNWHSKKDISKTDITIESENFIWNTTHTDWINSSNSVNEVGCIHTIQGYDLNYAGIIIGPELTYDEENNKIKVLKENYYDTKGKVGIKDEKELEKYIKNIYSVLLSRGINGTYVYVCDSKLREYLRKFLEQDKESKNYELSKSDNLAIAEKKRKY